MRVRSLRWRLTLLFTGVAAVVLLAAALEMSSLVEEAAWGPVDAALEEEAETLTILSALGHADELASAVARLADERDLGAGKFVRVTAADGRLLASAGAVPARLGRSRNPPPPARAFTYTRRGATIRIARHPTPDGGTITIGVGAMRVSRAIRRARLLIAGGSAGVLVVLAVLAWAMAGRATAELGRLAAELETIEAGSLDRRLAPHRTAEVDRLSAVLNRLLARLERAVGHLRRFTADAAHELRTPIAALRAHLEVALAPGRSAETYRDGLLDALEQAERLERLAEDLLALTTVEAGAAERNGRLDTVPLDALAREVAEFMEPVAQEQQRPFAVDATSGVAVRGAPDLLKRLLLNLLDNAFRHTPPATAVRLVVRGADDRATIEVCDAGPGIPPEEVPRVFEPFRRGPGAGGGSGLGLALCREIVARHRGEIAIGRAAEGGARVTVRLPLARAG
ncbi:MAG TPA: ATP-binding protein [Candidatus Binatia bacterium]|jgi:signal transduction histidine kinase|nr:ATP-binding protein [Candidatus Binatia bacterium]